MEKNKGQNNSYSSIYFRRVKELLKMFDEDAEKNKYKNDRELYICYDYSDLSKKGYFYRYKDQDKVIGLREARVKNPNWIKFERVLEGLDFSIDDYSKMKNIDPNLVEILYNEKGDRAVYSYIEQLNKGKKGDKSLLPYSMRYNLTSVWRNKKLSFAQKLKIMRMARKNKHIADVDFKARVGRKLAAVFAAVGLLFSAGPKLGTGNFENEKNDRDNSMVDIIEDTEKQDDINIEETTKAPKSNDSYRLSKEEKNKVLSETQKLIEKYNKHNEEKREQEKINEEKTKDLELGTLMRLPEGVQFMEGVSGGRVGTIGDEASPATGIYVIDHSAEVSENGVRSIYGLDGKIDKNVSDSTQYVHIAFVNGASSMEEAQKIIQQEKENAKNNVVDTNRIQPRGWISKDTVQQLYNMQQKGKQNQVQDFEK